jgi:hypothetical protein
MKHPNIIAPVNYFLTNIDVWTTKTAKSLISKGVSIAVCNDHMIKVGYLAYNKGILYTKDKKQYKIPNNQLTNYKEIIK